MKKIFNFGFFLVGILIISLVSAGLFTGNVAKEWSNNYCKDNSCGHGMGDCNPDKGAYLVNNFEGQWKASSQCLTGWCHLNVGALYGKNSKLDVCECPTGTVWNNASRSCEDPSYTDIVLNETPSNSSGNSGSSGGTFILSEFENRTVYANGESYTVWIDHLYYSSVRLGIDSEVISTLSEGESWDIDGVNAIRVNEILYSSRDNVTTGVELSIVSVGGDSSGEVSYQGVLDMLSKCEVMDSGASTGHEVCESWNKTCAFSIMRMKRIAGSDYSTKLVDCSTKPNQEDLRDSDDFNVLCCSI